MRAEWKGEPLFELAAPPTTAVGGGGLSRWRHRQAKPTTGRTPVVFNPLPPNTIEGSPPNSVRLHR